MSIWNDKCSFTLACLDMKNIWRLHSDIHEQINLDLEQITFPYSITHYRSV